MKHKVVSNVLSKKQHKNLSKWNEAITEAKKRVAALKRSIRYFEDMRDRGAVFPEPISGETSNRKGLEA